MYGWIADACDESSHVVTASRRLARVLTAAYVESQLSAGRTAWSTPSIRSLPDWLRRLAASAPHARQATWIGAQQSRVLWQQVIRQEINDPFVNVSALAWHAREAWKRLHDWRVPFDEFLASSVGQDQRIFARVASVYRQRLIERHWIDDASAGQFLLQCLEEGNLRLPARITLAGFDRLTPLMEAVLEGASSRGASVSEAPHAPPADTCTFSYANPDAELRGAGAWARATLQSEPTASVAIVVSNLEQDSGRAAQLIREGFVPGWQYARGEPASSVNVSYGRRLSEFPAIQVALLLLSWLHRDLRGGDISILLRTPFLGESAAGPGWNFGYVPSRIGRGARHRYSTRSASAMISPMRLTGSGDSHGSQVRGRHISLRRHRRTGHSCSRSSSRISDGQAQRRWTAGTSSS